MPMKIYTYDEKGKFIEQRILISDREEGMKQHKVIYHMPTDVSYTRIRPLKPVDGKDIIFVDDHWEYREPEVQHEEPVENS